MCLSEVFEPGQAEYFEPCDKGYQVKFKAERNGKYFALHSDTTNRVTWSLKKTKYLAIGKIYKAPKDEILSDSMQYYKAGFHIFHDIKDAINYVGPRKLKNLRSMPLLRYKNDIVVYCIVEVQAMGEKTVGTQNGKRVTVASKIKLLREIPIEYEI